MKLLIKNGYVIDPTQGVNAGRHVLIENGRVAGLLAHGGDDAPLDAEIFDASGCVVAPGFIDMHVHLREPGHEYKETIATGAAAAAAGGWTSVCAMPNTQPVNDNAAVTRFIIEQAERARANESFANVFPIGAITKGSNGAELAEMGEMRDAGIIAVSDDGRPVPNAGMMRRAMEYASNFDLPVVDHCEDVSLAGKGVMHEGAWSVRLGLRGIPPLAEEQDAARDCQLAELTGARVHLCHVSTRGTIEIVRRAKERGIKVTCEVTPHHFTLTDAVVEGYDTNVKMNPPLRSDEHLGAILEALKDGTIDAIATDHAPHHADEKSLEFDYAPFGITGLETSLGLACDKLLHAGIIDLTRLVELCAVNPARIFRLENRGTLKQGAHADVTIFDPELAWKVDVSKMRSKSRNTPFNGWNLRGAPVATFVGGKMVFKR